MNSCLYNCQVSHKRSWPKEHSFSYRIFMFMLDLDEIDQLCESNPIISRNSSNLYEFRDADHYSVSGKSIRESVETYVRSQGITERIGRIYLVTNLRFFGHVFNPVSFYFLESDLGAPLGAVAEVANTFNEQKMYFLPAESLVRGAYRSEQRKHFYVSPYSDLDTDFRFALRRPCERIAISINQLREGSIFFRSLLSGTREVLTGRSLLGETLRFPFVTLKIVVGIHWHAFRLFLRGVGHRKKKSNPELQRETRPYLTGINHSTH